MIADSTRKIGTPTYIYRNNPHLAEPEARKSTDKTSYSLPFLAINSILEQHIFSLPPLAGAENPMPGNSRTIPFPTHVRMLVYAQLNTLSSAFSAFPSYIFRHFNAAAFTLRCYLFYFVRMRFISSFHQSIAFIIPVLMTFLQLKYQGNDQKSPFATHPRSMRVAVSSSVVYYLACVVLLRFSMRRFAVVAHHCLVWSGYASVAALASVLFPDSVSPFIYALFVLLSAGELLYWLYHKLAVEEEEGGDFQRVRRFVNNICRVVANSSRQRLQILPI